MCTRVSHVFHLFIRARKAYFSRIFPGPLFKYRAVFITTAVFLKPCIESGKRVIHKSMYAHARERSSNWLTFPNFTPTMEENVVSSKLCSLLH